MKRRRRDLGPLRLTRPRIRIRVYMFPRPTPVLLSMLFIRPDRSSLAHLDETLPFSIPHRTQPELLIPYSRTTTTYDEEDFGKRDRSAKRIYNRILIGDRLVSRDLPEIKAKIILYR